MAVASWADVPDNVLVRVLAFLPCRADRVHMSCVNKHWCAAVRRERRPPPIPPLPPQLPWIIFPNTRTPSFFSTIGATTHPLPLPPDVRCARCCGSFEGGWLVLALDGWHAHALYNLNSGRRIRLPARLRTPKDREFPFVTRAATLSASPAPGDYIVAAIVLFAGGSKAAFWWEGSASWSSCEGPMRTHGAELQDVIYYGRAFYFVTANEDVVVFVPGLNQNGEATLLQADYDVQQRHDYRDDMGFVRGVGSMKRYLVESRGDLLMVVRYVYDETGTEMLRVFRFDVAAPTSGPGSPRASWVHLGWLDGRMLFVGRGCSRSFEVAQFHEFEDSMIYFLDDCFAGVPTGEDKRLYSLADMGRYSMDETEVEPWPPEDRRPSMSDNAPPIWWLH